MRSISAPALFTIAIGIAACSSEDAPDDEPGTGGASAGTAGSAGSSAGSGGSAETSAGASGSGGGAGSNAGGGGGGGGGKAGAGGALSGAGGAAGSGGTASGASGAGAGGANGGAGGSAGAAAGAGGNGGAAGNGGASGNGGAGGNGGASGEVTPLPGMNFFVTSSGLPNGGNLGSLEDADAFCTMLATGVSEALGAKTWRAYLSTTAVDARDRIGTGPWRNQAGAIIAENLDDLHAQEPGEALDETWPPGELSVALDENGEQVVNDVHDILTGSNADGTLFEGNNCDDWSSASELDTAGVGHSNRSGGGRPPSFNATHTVGCAPFTSNRESGTVSSGGGRGSLYCFALEPSTEA